MNTKNCSNKNCKEINPQPISEFGRDRYSEDGFCCQCKSCQKETRLFRVQRNKEYELALGSGKEAELIAWKNKYHPEKDGSIKKCASCKDVKNIGEFYVYGSKGRLGSYCKTCSKEKNNKYVSLPFDIPDTSKICTGCKKQLDLTYFRKDSHKKDGLSTRCIDCHKNQQLEIRYGITLEDFSQLLELQEHRCAICSKEDGDSCIDRRTGKKYRFALDHCHETGKIRGVLCNDCNTGIGLFKDNIELLLKAIYYLKTNK